MRTKIVRQLQNALLFARLKRCHNSMCTNWLPSQMISLVNFKLSLPINLNQKSLLLQQKNPKLGRSKLSRGFGFISQ